MNNLLIDESTSIKSSESDRNEVNLFNFASPRLQDS